MSGITNTRIAYMFAQLDYAPENYRQFSPEELKLAGDTIFDAIMAHTDEINGIDVYELSETIGMAYVAYILPLED